MPSISSKFTLRDTDIERLKSSISNCGESSERVINDYLHNKGGKKITDSITRFIPVSKKGKRHAKNSKWYAQDDYNLAVNISNSLEGKRGTSFYYLYYVATGTGTSRKKGSNKFMDKGMDKVYDQVVDELLDELGKNIEREMS